MESPLVDGRSVADLVAQTTKLAQTKTGWEPSGDADPAAALIGIFGMFAGLVVDELNAAPALNHLAFLDLIGTRPQPPLPATVPLTFTAAPAGADSPVVPAGTQVSAKSGDTDVVFQTDSELVVTRAVLTGVFVGEPAADRYTEVGPGSSFAAFEGDTPVPHEMLVAVPARTGPVTVEIDTADTAIWTSSVEADGWDGAQWQPLAITSRPTATGLALTLTGGTALAENELEGVKSAWVRLTLTIPLPSDDEVGALDQVSVGARSPQEFSSGLAPFGDPDQSKFLYLSVGAAAAPAGSTAVLRVVLERPGKTRRNAAVRLNWTCRSAGAWAPLTVTDGTNGFTQDGDITLTVPADWSPDQFRGVAGRWLRIEVDDRSPAFTTLPLLDSVSLGHEWNLPLVTGVRVPGDPAPPPIPVPAVANDGVPCDISRGYLPFGSQPGYDSTVEVLCPPELAAGPLTLDVTLVNGRSNPDPPVPRVADTNPTIVWETFDGTLWRTAQRTTVFDDGGTVTITPAAPPQPTMVAGVTGTWVRARITHGDYGRPASYVPGDNGYVLVESTLAPPMIAALSWAQSGREAGPPEACLTRNGLGYRSVDPAQPFAPFGPDQETTPALYAGFDRPFGAGEQVTLHLTAAPPAPEEVGADRLADVDASLRPTVQWEYLGPGGWAPLVVEDRTVALAASGTVTFLAPAIQPAERFGSEGAWLRVRPQQGDFAVRPRLSAVRVNTVTATQAVTVTEVLGSGNGSPGQTVGTARTPVLPGAVVEVGGTAWRPVGDFYDSGPDDHHYTLDALSGLVTFGDGKAGALPPVLPGNLRITYASGGGVIGNRPAGTVATLHTSLPSIASVTNPEAATGGADAVTGDVALARGSTTLRHRDRAVTQQDVEDLAYAASTEVARVKVMPAGRFDPLVLWMDPKDPETTAEHRAAQAGRVGVIVVPDTALSRPAPGYALLAEVSDYLHARCPATARPWVAGPEWIEVAVSAVVVPERADRADTVRDAVTSAIAAFLHPLTGGPEGTGWAFGRIPYRSDLFAVAEGVDGVGHVRSLTLELAPVADADLAFRIVPVLNRTLAQVASTPPAADVLEWVQRALVSAGDVDVAVTLVGER